ncbi:hypothetical protein quinque_015059 [Culex quinquefasciatus]
MGTGLRGHQATSKFHWKRQILRAPVMTEDTLECFGGGSRVAEILQGGARSSATHIWVATAGCRWMARQLTNNRQFDDGFILAEIPDETTRDEDGGQDMLDLSLPSSNGCACVPGPIGATVMFRSQMKISDSDAPVANCLIWYGLKSILRSVVFVLLGYQRVLTGQQLRSAVNLDDTT